ncbi:MAG: hypothetical protein K1X78_27585 [Verrucomicrobiaceae bacterium]|nr:hypothetical protein [Verrucomicrobiaceae bacterium]
MTRISSFWFLAAGTAALLASCDMLPQRPTPKEQFFLSEVKPILEHNCLVCHHTDSHPSGLNLTGPRAVVASRRGRAFVVPGRPNASLLVTAISRSGSHPKVMPRLDMSLTEDQIAVLREWIQDGAAWPGGARGRLVAKANPER